MRLKLIRDGYEDYEYLKLLAGAWGGSGWAVHSVARPLCGLRASLAGVEQPFHFSQN